MGQVAAGGQPAMTKMTAPHMPTAESSFLDTPKNGQKPKDLHQHIELFTRIMLKKIIASLTAITPRLLRFIRAFAAAYAGRGAALAADARCCSGTNQVTFNLSNTEL